MTTVAEMRNERATLINEARAILDRASAARREPSAEDRRQFDAMMSRADDIETRYSRIEKLHAAERSLATSQGRETATDRPGRLAGQDGMGRSSVEYRNAYASYLRDGLQACSPVEQRALSSSDDVQGGYLRAPQQLARDLIKALDDTLWIRALATKFELQGADSLGMPSLDADPADAAWTSELATGNEDSSMAFGKRELVPRPIAKRIKVSSKLLRTAPKAEAVVRERLTYKFSVTEEKAFLTGDGAGKPLGLFTASNDGIPTSRDVSVDNTTTALTGDGLINALYSLKSGYQSSPSLRWLFHRDAVKMIRKLKSNDNQYLWQPGAQLGQPDRLFNVPVVTSEFCPNTFTAGQYVGMVADFKYYAIADSLGISIQRLVELYAETNQVGFIGRLEVDGMPVLAEAFARVQLAAS